MKTININEQHLVEIESLLSQSVRGIHYLFDNDSIAKILSTPTEDLNLFTNENMDKVEDLLAGLVRYKSFHKKRRYLEELSPNDFEVVLRTYFHIVDSTVFENSEHIH